MSSADRVLIASIFLPAALLFFRAQALPGRRGTHQRPRLSLTRRGLWVWPDPPNTAGTGPAADRRSPLTTERRGPRRPARPTVPSVRGGHGQAGRATHR